MKSSFNNKETILVFYQELGDDVALLRRDPLVLNEECSSDWDIGVKDSDQASMVMRSCFGEPVTRIRRSYVHQHYYPWGQVDFIPDFVWRGLTYLKQDRFWNSVEKDEDGATRPRIAHDAFLAWLTGVIAGGNFNERHTAMILRAYQEDGEEFSDSLNEAFGEKWGGKLYKMLEDGKPADAKRIAKPLRKALLKQHLRSAPIKTLIKKAGHWYTELKWHLKPALPTIAFIGPDGSGKSSVINGVKAELKQMRLKTKSLHWRPFGLKGREDLGPVSDPHAEEPRGVVTSTLKLGLLFYDWWLASLTVLLHVRAKISVVICDRYYNDLLVDPTRYRYGGPKWLARLVFKCMPKPDMVFVLSGDPKIIHPRKEEVTFEELSKQLNDYEKLAESLGDKATLINVNGSLEGVIDEVFVGVIEQLKKRHR